jgi:transcriptional regulator with XRE-family HTH domain
MIKTTLSERLLLTRKKSQHSQQYLADLLSVDRSSLANWESGKTTIPTLKLISLATLCGVSWAWLITGEGEPDDHLYNTAPINERGQHYLSSSAAEEEKVFLLKDERELIYMYRNLPAEIKLNYYALLMNLRSLGLAAIHPKGVAPAKSQD